MRVRRRAHRFGVLFLFAPNNLGIDSLFTFLLLGRVELDLDDLSLPAQPHALPIFLFSNTLRELMVSKVDPDNAQWCTSVLVRLAVKSDDRPVLGEVAADLGIRCERVETGDEDRGWGRWAS